MIDAAEVVTAFEATQFEAAEAQVATIVMAVAVEEVVTAFE